MDNCKNYCRYARYCYAKGSDGQDPEECAMYYKVEDLLWDAICDKMNDPKEEPEDPNDWEE